MARLREGRRTGKGELNHFIHKINLKQSQPSASIPHVKKEICACIYVRVMMLVLLVICFRDWLQQELLDPYLNTLRKESMQN